MSGSGGEFVAMVCPQCGQRLRLPAGRLADGPRCPSCKAQALSGHPVELNDKSFARFIGGTDLPVLVDFWAAWCGPCRSFAPTIERAAGALTPRAVVAKVDTDASPATANQFGIRSIPTVVLFKGGVEVARQSGAMPAQALTAWLAESGVR